MPDSLKGRGETKRNPAPWGEPGLSAVLPSVRNHRAIKKLLSSLSPLYSTLPTSSSGYSLLLSILTEPISCLYSTKLSTPLHFPPLFSTFFSSLWNFHLYSSLLQPFFYTLLFLCGPLVTRRVCRAPRPVMEEKGILVVEVSDWLRSVRANTSFWPGLLLDGRLRRLYSVNRLVVQALALLEGCGMSQMGQR